MTFTEILQTAEEMQCMIVPDRDGRDYTLYSEKDETWENSVCWIIPSAYNGYGSISSTYHFPQVNGFENFTKEEMIARIAYIRQRNKERYIEKRLEKMEKDFNDERIY